MMYLGRLKIVGSYPIFFGILVLLNAFDIHRVGANPRRLNQESDNIQQAQNMIQTGQSLLKQKKYRAAIPYFERSHTRVPDVKNLFTLGAIYSKLKQCPKALSYWTSAQVMCGRCGLSSQLDQAIMKHTRSCSTELSVQSLPRAKVIIDQQEVGETPYTGRLLHGTHTLILNTLGHLSHKVRIQADRDRPVNIDVVLTPEGRQLGVTNQKSPSPLKPPLSQRPAVKPIAEQSVSAEAWLRAEEINKQSRAERRILKTTLISSGVVLGLSALGLYAYTTDRYRALKEKEKTTVMRDKNLYNQAQTADNVQTVSGVLGIVGLILMSSTLLIP